VRVRVRVRMRVRAVRLVRAIEDAGRVAREAIDGLSVVFLACEKMRDKSGESHALKQWQQ